MTFRVDSDDRTTLGCRAIKAGEAMPDLDPDYPYGAQLERSTRGRRIG